MVDSPQDQSFANINEPSNHFRESEEIKIEVVLHGNQCTCNHYFQIMSWLPQIKKRSTVEIYISNPSAYHQDLN